MSQFPHPDRIPQEPHRSKSVVQKVRRISDGKIFSSTYGAALGENGKGVSVDGWSGGMGGGQYGHDPYQSKGPVSQLSANNIQMHCDGFLDTAFNGEKYEYVLLPARGIADHSERVENFDEVEEMRKKILALKRKNYYPMMRHWLETAQDKHVERTAWELYGAVMQMAYEDDVRPRPTMIETPASSMSRHILAYENIYKKWGGLVIGETRVPRTHKPINTYSFIEHRVDPDFDIDVPPEIYRYVEGSKPMYWFKANPVVDGVQYEIIRSFRSMSEAYDVTGVSTDRMVACCEGDVFVIHTDGKYMAFKYLIEVEEYVNQFCYKTMSHKKVFDKKDFDYIDKFNTGIMDYGDLIVPDDYAEDAS